MRESKLVASRITDERIEFRQIWWLSRGKRVTPHDKLRVIATSMEPEGTPTESNGR